MKHTTIVLLCLIGVIGYSCKSSKQVRKPTETIAMEDKARFDALLSNVPQFDTFSSKVNVKITFQGKTVGARGTLKMVKDKALQLSVQPFGIEMFRLYMTPDSIILIDKMNGRYLEEKLDKYLSRLPLQLHLGMLQALFLNQPFLSAKKHLVPDDYKYFSYQNESSFLLMKAKGESRVSYGFFLNRDNLIEHTEVMSLPLPSALTLKWDYSLFEQSDGIWFPKKSDAVISDRDGNSTFALQITYSKPQWNEPVEITPPSVSKKYERLNAEALIKLLSK